MQPDYIEKEITVIKMEDANKLIVPREDDNSIADIPQGVRILQMQPDTSLQDMRDELSDDSTVFDSFIGGVEIPSTALTEIIPNEDITYQEKYFCMSIDGADTAMLFAMQCTRVKDGKCGTCSNGISGEEIKNLSVIFGIDNCYNKRYFNKRVAEWTAENVQEDEL